MNRFAFLLSAPAAWLLAAPLLVASEESGSGGRGNLFAGDIGNAVWTIVIFGAVIFVLGKFAWGPMLEALQRREDFIRDSLTEAKRQNDEAESRLKKYTDKLEAARAEATLIVDEGRRDAEVVKQRIESEAQGEADKMIVRARREIEIAKHTAIKDLYTTSGKLATAIASRVIKRELSAEDHERLIVDAIDELGEFEAN